MIGRFLRLASAAAAALLVLAGCGGGGGGGDGPRPPGGFPLTITVLQSPITASFTQIDLPALVPVSASVQGETSATTIFVVIVDATATFSGPAAVSQTGPTTYQALLPLADQLSIGPHSGALQI